MKEKINSLVFAILLIAGLGFPTSVEGNISIELSILHSFLLIFLLFILLINNGIIIANLFIVLLINLLLLTFTLLQVPLNNLERISLGAYLPYLIFSILLLINLKKIHLKSHTKIMFLIVNIVNILLGLTIINDVQYIEKFLLNNYSLGYDELLTNMLIQNKPVTFFGAHSIASFMNFILFYLNFTSFKREKNKISLLLALGNLTIIFFLNSVAAYIFFAMGVIILLIFFLGKYRLSNYILVFFLLGISIFLYGEVKENLAKVFASENNGFLGRYSSAGILQNNLDYISSNLLPIGLWISDNLYFTDSGYILNYLKGSLFLVLSVYTGLFIFLKKNLLSRKIFIQLFLLLMIFEIAYPFISYIRLLYLLPFFIVYLNYLSREEIKNI
ncbi:MAG: hypothetical protein KKF57_14470 [Firmicutes bacterium]|nr:hypothetical protein [Bacillota bacterium]